jgi:ADP-ribose pyrophosphatase YjhB (NUDIX family)
VEDGVDRRASKAHVAYEVDGLGAWRAKLAAAGTEILEGEPIPGWNRFEFRDPFGNRVEFLERASPAAPRPRVRAAVFLASEGRVLLCRLRGRDFWILPGGRQEPGESLAQCASREMMEEEGAWVEVDRPFFFGEFIAPDAHVLDFAFVGELKGYRAAVVPPPAEVEELRWVPVADARALTVKPPPLAAVLRQADFDPARLRGVFRWGGVYGP